MSDQNEKPATPGASEGKSERARKMECDLGNVPVGGAVLPEDAALRDEIVQVLQTCYDPEIPVDIYQLGLIYRVDVLEEGKIEIDMTLTSPNCPAAQSLPAEVETKIKGLGGVSEVNLEIVWEPTWGPQYLSEAAKLQLGVPE